MWTWLRATCVPFYGTYWTIRGMQEFESLFGRLPLTWLKDVDVDQSTVHEDFRTMLAAELDRVTVHFGEGRLNPSTIACTMMEVERRLAEQFGVTLPSETPISAFGRLIRREASALGPRKSFET